jgi:hypothetical protein
MSLWKKLVGTLVEIETKPTTTPNPELPLKQQMTTDQSTPVVKSFDTTQTATATPVNADLKQHFLELIKQNNLPGPDYYEFTLMLDAMHLVTNPEVKYVSAFNALKAQGMSLEVLLQPAEKYKAIIVADQKEFEAEFGNVFKSKVADKKALVEQKAQEVQALAVKIQTINEEMKAMSAEISNDETQLTVQKNQYITAGNSVVQDIEMQLGQIKTYIKQ